MKNASFTNLWCNWIHLFIVLDFIEHNYFIIKLNNDGNVLIAGTKSP